MVGRLFLAHAIIMGWGGIPVIWMGDEIAMVNDPDWAAEPGHESDNRWAHRPRMDWARAERRHELHTVEGRVFLGIRHLARCARACRTWNRRWPPRSRCCPTRASCRCCAGTRSGRCWSCSTSPTDWRPFPGWRLAELGLAGARDALSGNEIHPGPDGNVWLHPYGVLWLVQD